MTVQELLKKTTHIDRLDAELLLAHILHCSKVELLSNRDQHVSLLHRFKFWRAVEQRKAHIPLAYITGHKEFYCLDFFVSKDTLVPRPDTELMVELALKEIAKSKTPVELIDVGTGTGCIPISIIKNTKNVSRATALDVSLRALKVAQKNAAHHGVELHCLQSNLLKNIAEFSEHSTVVLTANLPYLTQEEIDSEASIQQEPHLALYADDFGLSLYKELQKEIKFLLKKSKMEIVLYMEINDHQADALVEYTKEEFPEGKVLVHKDLSGKRRVVEVLI